MVELAKVVGMVDGASLTAAEARIHELDDRARIDAARITDLENFQELAARLVPKPAPKPVKKPENRPYETDRVKSPVKAAKETV